LTNATKAHGWARRPHVGLISLRPSLVTTSPHVFVGSLGHGLPGSWYEVFPAISIVSPGAAASMAAWID
jgi:hypothetical protein